MNKMTNNSKYAVVIYQTFDTDAPVHLFNTYEKAKEYLYDVWKDTYDTELRESIVPLDKENTFHEDEYAKITWVDRDYMEYILTTPSESIVNGKCYE